MSPDTIARIEGEQTRLRLARHPEAQAEAIAYHYARFAALAVHLLELTKIRRLDGPDKDTDAIIGMLVEDIQKAHLKDLGIPLEWPANESDTLYRRPDSGRQDLRLDSWREERRIGTRSR